MYLFIWFVSIYLFVLVTRQAIFPPRSVLKTGVRKTRLRARCRAGMSEVMAHILSQALLDSVVAGLKGWGIQLQQGGRSEKGTAHLKKVFVS